MPRDLRRKMRPEWWRQPWKSIARMNRTSDLQLAKFLTGERHRVHLIGVAGSGMSGLAALLLELGHEVSGSDKASTQETARLSRLGLQFCGPHRAEDVEGVEIVIYSSAIKPDNPILAKAQERS